MSAKVDRCIRLLLAFQQRGTLANRHIRELLECDEQTASRDVRSLFEAGVPLEVKGTGSDRHYRIDPGWRRTGVDLSLGDALSLHFGRKLLSFLEGTVFPEWHDELRRKLDIGADPRTLDRRGRFSRKLVYLSEPARHYAAHDDTLDTLVRGLLEEREITADYRSRRGKHAYTLRPLALVIYRRALYLLAASDAHETVLRLPVDRFVTATLGEPFPYPEDFDPNDLLANTFGIFDDGREPEAVRLRFEPGVADLVRARDWHRSQRFEDGPDGTVDLVLQASGPELARLALEWGNQVEVLQPAWLRSRVRQELKDALRQYETDT
jgi:proteasome accessory factor B